MSNGFVDVEYTNFVFGSVTSCGLDRDLGGELLSIDFELVSFGLGFPSNFSITDWTVTFLDIVSVKRFSSVLTDIPETED